MIVGDVRELGVADHVANGEHAPVGRHETAVHLDAAAIIDNASRFQIESRHVRRAAGRDQQIRALYDLWMAVVRDVNVDEAGASTDAIDVGAFRISTPSARSADSTMSETSGSSLPSTFMASISVTRLPRRANAWAISTPIARRRRSRGAWGVPRVERLSRWCGRVRHRGPGWAARPQTTPSR